MTIIFKTFPRTIKCIYHEDIYFPHNIFPLCNYLKELFDFLIHISTIPIKFLQKLSVFNVFDIVTACYFYKEGQIIKRVGGFPRDLALLQIHRELTQFFKMIRHLKFFPSQDTNKL